MSLLLGNIYTFENAKSFRPLIVLISGRDFLLQKNFLKNFLPTYQDSRRRKRTAENIFYKDTFFR